MAQEVRAEEDSQAESAAQGLKAAHGGRLSHRSLYTIYVGISLLGP